MLRLKRKNFDRQPATHRGKLLLGKRHLTAATLAGNLDEAGFGARGHFARAMRSTPANCKSVAPARTGIKRQLAGSLERATKTGFSGFVKSAQKAREQTAEAREKHPSLHPNSTKPWQTPKLSGSKHKPMRLTMRPSNRTP